MRRFLNSMDIINKRPKVASKRKFIENVQTKLIFVLKQIILTENRKQWRKMTFYYNSLTGSKMLCL